jgi:hypothetical protein
MLRHQTSYSTLVLSQCLFWGQSCKIRQRLHSVNISLVNKNYQPYICQTSKIPTFTTTAVSDCVWYLLAFYLTYTVAAAYLASYELKLNELVTEHHISILNPPRQFSDSPPTSAEVQKAWLCTATPTCEYVSMAKCDHFQHFNVNCLFICSLLKDVPATRAILVYYVTSNGWTATMVY